MDRLALVGATRDVLAQVPAPQRLLTHQERARADRFRFSADRDDFIAAHALVRLCAAAVSGLRSDQLTLLQRCGACGGPHGPPRIAEAPELAVSLSHTRGHVAASVAPGATGVDVELVDRRWVEGLAGVALAAAETRFIDAAPDPGLAFLELWVRKEALIKARATSTAELSKIDLVGETGRIADRWGGLLLTIWQHGRVMGACASARPTPWRPVATSRLRVKQLHI